jgi:hypothetical protein
MKKILLLLVLLSLSPLALASTFTLNFEQYPEFTQIVGQYEAEDIVFGNAMQLVAPDYNYFDYPPHSGSGVLTDDPNDPLGFGFITPVTDVSGWYSDPYGVTAIAFGFYGNVLGTFTGAPVIGADSEFTLDPEGGIYDIVLIDSSQTPDFLTLDDLTYTETPEPGSLLLLGTGVLGLVGTMRRKLRR